MKKFSMVLFMVFVSLLMVGCGNKTNNSSTNTNKQVVKNTVKKEAPKNTEVKVDVDQPPVVLEDDSGEFDPDKFKDEDIDYLVAMLEGYAEN